MAEDGVKDDKNLAAGGNLAASAELNKGTGATKQRRGILSRIWNGMFRTKEDFEKRLQYLSKEEASVHVRIKRRAQSWRRTARNVIYLSTVLEILLIGYAIIATRTLGLDWKMRAGRVLPMFILPGLSYAIYSMLSSFTRMRERKDQKTLERLRAERQAKIDELKERTNYYSTQQLIQRYDLDPAAKAAAASVLAHKLGADSGLKVSVGDESKANMPTGKSNDVQVVQSSGLRNRRPSSHSRSSSTGSITMPQIVEESTDEFGIEGKDVPAKNQTVVVGHYQQSATSDGGWLARIAALLVGEDPTQCFALICGNCHMHNGLARKEDFSYITYYCPHCHALNGSQQPEGPASGSGFGSGSGSGSGSTSSSKKVSPRPLNDDVIELSGTDDIIGLPNSPAPSDGEIATISKTALDD